MIVPACIYYVEPILCVQTELEFDQQGGPTVSDVRRTVHGELKAHLELLDLPLEASGIDLIHPEPDSVLLATGT